MKIILKCICITFLTIVVRYNLAKSTKPVTHPYDIKYQLIDYSPSTGDVTIEISIQKIYPMKKFESRDFKAWLEPVDGLEYFDDVNWIFPLDTGEIKKEIVHLRIPVNDTSGIIIHVDHITYDVSYPLYILAINDTALFTYSNPLYQHHLPRYGTPEEEAEKNLKEYQAAMKRYEEEQDKLSANPTYKEISSPASVDPEDSTFYITLNDGEKSLFLQMRRKEKRGVLEGKKDELYIFKNKAFRRYEGDRYFKEEKMLTKEEIKQSIEQRRDSIRTSNPDKLYEVYVDFRVQKDYDNFKDKVESIEPTIKDGFYKITCSKAVLGEIEKKKIKYIRVDRPSWRKIDKEFEGIDTIQFHPPKKSSQKESSEVQNSLFFESFEGSWKGCPTACDRICKQTPYPSLLGGVIETIS